MSELSIVTKVQFNAEEDAVLFELLKNTSKRKRAYVIKKLLSEYLQVKNVLNVKNSDKEGVSQHRCSNHWERNAGSAMKSTANSEVNRWLGAIK